MHQPSSQKTKAGDEGRMTERIYHIQRTRIACHPQLETYCSYRKATTDIRDFNFFPSFLPGKSDQTLFLVESGR